MTSCNALFLPLEGADPVADLLQRAGYGGVDRGLVREDDRTEVNMRERVNRFSGTWGGLSQAPLQVGEGGRGNRIRGIGGAVGILAGDDQSGLERMEPNLVEPQEVGLGDPEVVSWVTFNPFEPGVGFLAGPVGDQGKTGLEMGRDRKLGFEGIGKIGRCRDDKEAEGDLTRTVGIGPELDGIGVMNDAEGTAAFGRERIDNAADSESGPKQFRLGAVDLGAQGGFDVRRTGFASGSCCRDPRGFVEKGESVGLSENRQSDRFGTEERGWKADFQIHGQKKSPGPDPEHEPEKCPVGEAGVGAEDRKDVSRGVRNRGSGMARRWTYTGPPYSGG